MVCDDTPVWVWMIGWGGGGTLQAGKSQSRREESEGGRKRERRERGQTQREGDRRVAAEKGRAD